MEDAEGYMVVGPSRHIYTDAIPKKTEAPSKCCKITLWIILGGSIALNLALIVLLIAGGEDCLECKCGMKTSTGLLRSCTKAPDSSSLAECGGREIQPEAAGSEGCLICKCASKAASVNFDPDTAHRHLVISRDRKTATWGKEEQPLPDNDKRFSPRVWVLGQNGFRSGKHCWEVEIKHDGEWAVGVARESVKRKGEINFSTKEGIWAIAESFGRRNYMAFTEPEHSKIFFDEKPRRIRVFLDYLYQEVEFFDVGTMKTKFTFSNASFSGERIYPWFRAWDGTELTVHP